MLGDQGGLPGGAGFRAHLGGLGDKAGWGGWEDPSCREAAAEHSGPLRFLWPPPCPRAGLAVLGPAGARACPRPPPPPRVGVEVPWTKASAATLSARVRQEPKEGPLNKRRLVLPDGRRGLPCPACRLHLPPTGPRAPGAPRPSGESSSLPRGDQGLLATSRCHGQVGAAPPMPLDVSRPSGCAQACHTAGWLLARALPSPLTASDSPPGAHPRCGVGPAWPSSLPWAAPLPPREAPGPRGEGP